MAERAIPPAYCRQDERGSFVEIVNRGPWEAVITGRMNAGAVMGNHYHKVTDCFFFVCEGRCRMDVVCVTDGSRSRLDLAAGQGAHLPRNHSHAIRFDVPSTFILLKSRAHDPDDPDTFAHPVPEEGTAAACDDAAASIT